MILLVFIDVCFMLLFNILPLNAIVVRGSTYAVLFYPFGSLEPHRSG